MHLFPCLSFKIKLQIKLGTQYPQTSRGHTKSLGSETGTPGWPSWPHASQPSARTLPLLQAPAEGKDRRHSKTGGAGGPTAGEELYGPQNHPINSPTLQMGKLRLWEAEMAGCPDRR